MTDYTHTSGVPSALSRGVSATIRTEFDLIQTAVNSKANTASPALTGVPTAPTASAGTSTTQLATTAFVANTAFSSALPSQTGNSGKYVTTDGTTASWAAVALPQSTLVFLSSVTASNSATVDIETTLDSTYDAYVIEATSIIPQTDGSNIGCQFKISGSYDTAANYYYHLDRNTAGSTSYTASVDIAATNIVVLFALSNAASANSQFFLRINAPSNSGRQKLITFSGANATAAPQVRTNTGVGMNTGTGVVTGLRFLASSGNIASGTFRLYGIKNS